MIDIVKYYKIFLDWLFIDKANSTNNVQNVKNIILFRHEVLIQALPFFSRQAKVNEV